jgi:hypothetical protein
MFGSQVQQDYRLEPGADWENLVIVSVVFIQQQLNKRGSEAFDKLERTAILGHNIEQDNARGRNDAGEVGSTDKFVFIAQQGAWGVCVKVCE